MFAALAGRPCARVIARRFGTPGRSGISDVFLFEEVLDGLVVARESLTITVLREAIANFRLERADGGSSDRRHTPPCGRRKIYLSALEIICMASDGSSDPPASMLTNAQRDWIRGEKEYRPSAERELRGRIRDRFAAAITVDMPLMADVEEEKLEDFVEATDRDTLADGLRSTVAFVYKVANVADLEAESIIEDGIELGRHGRADMILSRLREGRGPVTISDVEFLASADSVDNEELKGLVREYWGSAESDVGIGRLSNTEQAAEMMAETVINRHSDTETDAEDGEE